MFYLTTHSTHFIYGYMAYTYINACLHNRILTYTYISHACMHIYKPYTRTTIYTHSLCLIANSRFYKYIYIFLSFIIILYYIILYYIILYYIILYYIILYYIILYYIIYYILYYIISIIYIIIIIIIIINKMCLLLLLSKRVTYEVMAADFPARYLSVVLPLRPTPP